MPVSRAALAAALLLLSCGCGGGYDEAAHRADVVDALRIDTIDEPVWGQIRGLAQDHCDSSENVFALGVGMTLDGADPDRGVAMRRANITHLCPERVEELEGILADLGYAG